MKKRSSAKSRAERPSRVPPKRARTADAGTIPQRPTASRSFPPARVRDAGLTGGETSARRDGVTADDLAPETLLDEAGGGDPGDLRTIAPADSALSVVDASAAGLGDGPDEAEDAQASPIARAELERLRRRIARAGASPNDFEPAERSAGTPGRARNAPRH